MPTDTATQSTSQAWETCMGFIPYAQFKTMTQLCRGEEGDHFRDKFQEYAERFATMPKTYEQDGMGDNAVAHLHYFTGSADWYITERDMEAEQHQAFGWADLGYGGELGYISLVEICQHPSVDLDLYFAPAALAEIKAGQP